MHQISERAINFIVKEEVSSKAYFERHYQRPEWPKGASGITVAIGYDLGYATPEKIKADWGPLVSANMLPSMLLCAGVRGQEAKALLPKVKNDILIGWDEAMKVFRNRDIPQWIAATYRALPNCDLLSPTCLGVIVGLNYNRGVGGYTMSGDRYTEMRGIKEAMRTRNFTAIPALLDSMARIWEGTSTSGVAGRRHREADLFREGLKEQVPVTNATTPSPSTVDTSVVEANRPDAPARTKPPATTPAQNGTTGVIFGGGGWLATHMGLTGTSLALALIAVVVVGGGVWYAWYKNRNPS